MARQGWGNPASYRGPKQPTRTLYQNDCRPHWTQFTHITSMVYSLRNIKTLATEEEGWKGCREEGKATRR